jgi:hypothetical protein
MNDTHLILIVVGLSLFLGFLTGFAYRGCDWRRDRKAKQSALRRAARELRKNRY